jgi:hypothetical protein
MMEFLMIFLFAIAVVAFFMVGFGIRMLLRKNGKAINIHIGSNQHMKDRGITCAQTFDKMEQAKARKELRFKELSLKEEDQDELFGKGFC